MQQNQGFQSQRKCIINDHRQKNVLQICCFKGCSVASRWACEECMKKNIHVHGVNQELYLKDQQQIEQYLQGKMNVIKNSQQKPPLETQQLIIKLQEIQTDVNRLLKFLQNFEAEELNKNMQLISSTLDRVELDFYQISTEDFDQIIKISSEFVMMEWLEKFEKFDHRIQQFASTFKDLYSAILESNKLIQMRFQTCIKIIPKAQNPLQNTQGAPQRFVLTQQKVQPLGPPKQEEGISENDFQQIPSNQLYANQQYQMQANIQGNIPNQQMEQQKQTRIKKIERNQQQNDGQQPKQYQK